MDMSPERAADAMAMVSGEFVGLPGPGPRIMCVGLMRSMSRFTSSVLQLE